MTTEHDAGDSTGLVAAGLHYSYPAPQRLRRSGEPAADTAVLRGVDLHVRPGDRHALIGRSGSGKSTLLRLLLALTAPDAGTIHLDGRPVAPGSMRSLRWYRRAVQFVPQDPIGSLEPRFSAERSVLEPLVRLGVPGDRLAQARDALDRVGIGARLRDRRPRELSGGQAQRVAIARALALRPAVMLADEPVSGLDHDLRDQVLDLLGELAADGLGILFVSHDLDAVARLCDTASILADGRVVEQGPTSTLLRSPRHAATRELVGL